MLRFMRINMVGWLKTKRGARALALVHNFNGKIAVPILLYLLGVPGIIVILLWVVFFRGE